MLLKAIKTNRTLNITKGKEYDVYFFRKESNLACVENDLNDEVVLLKDHFEEKSSLVMDNFY